MKKVDDSSSNDGFLLRMGLNDNKAGMQGLDKEKINKIIMEATKVGLITFFFFPPSASTLSQHRKPLFFPSPDFIPHMCKWSF